MNIQIERAAVEQRTTVENLMALFLHDLSEYADDLLVDEQGMHRFDVMDLFFEREGLTPYLVRGDGALVGFILIQSGEYANPEHCDYVLNSFFILKRYRRQGVGTAAAAKLFELYPGRYCCGQLATNLPAVRFWKKVYAELGLAVFELEREEDGKPIVEQFFNTKESRAAHA